MARRIARTAIPIRLALAAALALCWQGAARAADKAPVDIGAIYNLTGSQAGLDGPSAQGAALAVDEAIRAGGVLGRQVRLIVRDGGSRSGLIAERTRELLGDNPRTAALMGLSDTDMVIAAAPVAARAGRAFLTSGATSPKLPATLPGHLFLACFGDNVQAAAAAEWLWRDRGVRTVSVLYNRTMSYTDLLQAYFGSRFRALGGAVASVESYGTDDLAGAVGRLAPADAVFFAAGPDEAAEGVRLLRAAGHAAPVIGGDGLDVAAFREPDAGLRNTYFATHASISPDNADPRVQAFLKAYAAFDPGRRPDAFTALGYDAARLLLSAISMAGSADPERVRAALGATTKFAGVTGDLGYPTGGGVPAKAVSILGVEDGRLRLVRQFVPVGIPAP